MGFGYSKSSDLEQEQKLATIYLAEIKEKQKVRKETNDELTTFSVNLMEYYSACHDVPKVMMMFPSYRNRCSLTRGILIHNVLEVTTTSERTKKVVEKINRM